MAEQVYAAILKIAALEAYGFESRSGHAPQPQNRKTAELENTMTDAAAKAAAILREDIPHSPAEQAAMNALDKDRWVLWHADDHMLGVVRMLHRAGLLRDPADEARRNQADEANARFVRQRHAASQRALSSHHQLVEQAVKKLEDGQPAAEVAAWMREMRTAISERHDRDTSPRVVQNNAVA